MKKERKPDASVRVREGAMTGNEDDILRIIMSDRSFGVSVEDIAYLHQMFRDILSKFG